MLKSRAGDKAKRDADASGKDNLIGNSKRSRNLDQRRLLRWDEIGDENHIPFVKRRSRIDSSLVKAPWQRDNEYIISGYRHVSSSFSKSWNSIWDIHNETVNIWSHIFGGLLFVTLPFLIYAQNERIRLAAELPDLIVFSTFFFGVATCFLLSATFHIINNHSEPICIRGNQLDYLGIVILMWGSTIPTVYYGFYCSRTLQLQYWSLISFLSLACAFTTFDSRFRNPSLRPYRTSMYSGLGFSATIFIVHGVRKYGWTLENKRMSIDWMMIMAALNMTGALSYGFRIPERWYPRRYDILGSSHQILHSMVILAGLAHMIGLLRAFNYTRYYGMSCQ